MKLLEFKKEQFFNYSTVDLLEGLLEEAKSGIVQEIHCLSILSNGNARITYSKTEDITRQIGHLEILKADIMKRFYGI